MKVQKNMKAYSFAEASELAGLLFGRILGRTADKTGFDYFVDELSTGKRTVRSSVVAMLTSEEFREKFFMNNTPNEAARELRIMLLKELKPSPEKIKSTAIAFLENDWRIAISDLIDSEEYKKAFGENQVPTIRY